MKEERGGDIGLSDVSGASIAELVCHRSFDWSRSAQRYIYTRTSKTGIEKRKRERERLEFICSASNAS